jgi:[ribosomal protein S18]-alanine N-acetyltransferase
MTAHAPDSLYRITPMDAPAASAIATWRYPPPYDRYNSAPGIEPYLLDPANAYFAARAGDDVVGFFCYGEEAQVPGGFPAGAYDAPDAVDIGLGLRPDLTGHGRGPAFVRAGLAFAWRRYAPRLFRLTVATFNERAIRVYEQVGFRRGVVFFSPSRGEDAEFMLMTRDAAPGPHDQAPPPAR